MTIMCLLVIENDLFKMLPAFLSMQWPIVKRNHKLRLSKIYKYFLFKLVSSILLASWDL